MDIKEAIKWLEENKGIKHIDVSEIKHIFYDELSDFSKPENILELAFKSDKDVIQWVQELKEDMDED